jgi:hypothetical protein
MSLCEHYVLSYDATFPYAGANGCPLEIDGRGFDTDRLEKMNEELHRILFDHLRDNESKSSLAKLPTRLRKMLTSCAEEAVIDEGELMRDEYADHSAFSEYLDDLLSQCPTYHGATRFEDSVSMASSAYSAHWATDAKKCSSSLNTSLTEDLRTLCSFGQKASVNQHP